MSVGFATTDDGPGTLPQETAQSWKRNTAQLDGHDQHQYAKPVTVSRYAYNSSPSPSVVSSATSSSVFSSDTASQSSRSSASSGYSVAHLPCDADDPWTRLMQPCVANATQADELLSTLAAAYHACLPHVPLQLDAYPTTVQRASTWPVHGPVDGGAVTPAHPTTDAAAPLPTFAQPYRARSSFRKTPEHQKAPHLRLQELQAPQPQASCHYCLPQVLSRDQPEVQPQPHQEQQQQQQLDIRLQLQQSANPRRSSANVPRLPPALTRQNERKGTFVDKLVDSATQIVETIWPLSVPLCGTQANPLAARAVLPLRTFIKETLRRSRTSYSTLQVALYYLIVIMPSIPEADLSGREQPDDGQAIRALQCGRRMFLAALILASKYLQDRNYSARAWSKISGLKVGEINGIEVAFCRAVDWRFHIPARIFDRWTELVLRYTSSSSPMQNHQQSHQQNHPQNHQQQGQQLPSPVSSSTSLPSPSPSPVPSQVPPLADASRLADRRCWKTIIPYLTPQLDNIAAIEMEHLHHAELTLASAPAVALMPTPTTLTTSLPDVYRCDRTLAPLDQNYNTSSSSSSSSSTSSTSSFALSMCSATSSTSTSASSSVSSAASSTSSFSDSSFTKPSATFSPSASALSCPSPAANQYAHRPDSAPVTVLLSPSLSTFNSACIDDTTPTQTSLVSARRAANTDSSSRKSGSSGTVASLSIRPPPPFLEPRAEMIPPPLSLARLSRLPTPQLTPHQTPSATATSSGHNGYFNYVDHMITNSTTTRNDINTPAVSASVSCPSWSVACTQATTPKKWSCGGGSGRRSSYEQGTSSFSRHTSVDGDCTPTARSSLDTPFISPSSRPSLAAVEHDAPRPCVRSVSYSAVAEHRCRSHQPQPHHQHQHQHPPSLARIATCRKSGLAPSYSASTVPTIKTVAATSGTLQTTETVLSPAALECQLRQAHIQQCKTQSWDSMSATLASTSAAAAVVVAAAAQVSADAGASASAAATNIMLKLTLRAADPQSPQPMSSERVRTAHDHYSNTTTTNSNNNNTKFSQRSQDNSKGGKTENTASALEQLAFADVTNSSQPRHTSVLSLSASSSNSAPRRSHARSRKRGRSSVDVCSAAQLRPEQDVGSAPRCESPSSRPADERDGGRNGRKERPGRHGKLGTAGMVAGSDGDDNNHTASHANTSGPAVGSRMKSDPERGGASRKRACRADDFGCLTMSADCDTVAQAGSEETSTWATKECCV